MTCNVNWRMVFALDGTDAVLEDEPGDQSSNPSRSGGCFDHAHFNVQSCSGGHVHQRIESEQVDLAAHQIGDAWLSHAEQLGGLCLAHFCAGQVVLQRRHQNGAQLHVFRFFRGVLDGIPDAGK